MSDHTQLDNEYAPGWRPEPGATVIGTITSVDIGYSTYVGQRNSYPIITVEQENGDGPIAIHAFHIGLFAQLLRLQPAIGERIGIKYHGKRPVKNNPSQEVAIYTVKVAGRTAADVWSTLTQTAPTSASQQELPANARDFAPPAHDDDDMPF